MLSASQDTRGVLRPHWPTFGRYNGRYNGKYDGMYDRYNAVGGIIVGIIVAIIHMIVGLVGRIAVILIVGITYSMHNNTSRY